METKRFDVVVIGELNPDLIVSGDVRPVFGQVEKIVESAELTIGSSSAIFACGAARLGLKVAFVGMTGKDLFGQFMRQSLEKYGIDVQGVKEVDGIPTGISVILANKDDRAIMTYPGTIPLLSYDDIDLELLKHTQHLHVGSYFIQDKLRRSLPVLFTFAHSLGVSISLDPNYDPLNVWDAGIIEVIPKVDLFLPNAVECQGIARSDNFDQAVAFLQNKVNYLGVKQGKEGAILSHKSKIYQMKPIEVNVIDTVGAGDSFDAGFIYGYLQKWEPERILKFALVCGSLSTRQAGGTAAQPTCEEAMLYM